VKHRRKAARSAPRSSSSPPAAELAPSERLKAERPTFVPWAWGINGIFSVLAPILAVAVSITWGISALLISALPIYLVAGFLLPGREAAPLEG
jgi:hypothetical protein